ncbi:hypothetical protein QVN03_09535 [Raoultella terrigena]|nr:hypothetical protein [Raoultella terrigena]WJV40740.1 hypothetical protein QVN03_09535 [Raoultella terrigena]
MMVNQHTHDDRETPLISTVSASTVERTFASCAGPKQLYPQRSRQRGRNG